MRRILDATAPESILRGDVVDRKPDSVWGRGRVTLLGDSAHAVSFNIGQGACLAIEDALVLAGHLAAPGAGVSGACAPTRPSGRSAPGPCSCWRTASA